jgi:hypothetical protein
MAAFSCEQKNTGAFIGKKINVTTERAKAAVTAEELVPVTIPLRAHLAAHPSAIFATRVSPDSTNTMPPRVPRPLS